MVMGKKKFCPVKRRTCYFIRRECSVGSKVGVKHQKADKKYLQEVSCTIKESSLVSSDAALLL
jgi:hypothetical protein